MANTTEQNVEIHLSGEGLNFDGKVSTQVASQIVQLCLSNEDPKGGDAQATSDLDSPAAALERYQPKQQSEKILTLAYYLKEAKSQKTFRPANITDMFREAAEPPPGNLVRDLRTTIRKGWIVRAGRQEYYITTRGISLLKGGF